MVAESKWEGKALGVSLPRSLASAPERKRCRTPSVLGSGEQRKLREQPQCLGVSYARSLGGREERHSQVLRARADGGHPLLGRDIPQVSRD